MIDRINLLPVEMRAVERGQFYVLAAGAMLISLAVFFFLYYAQQAKLDAIRSEETVLQSQVRDLSARSSAMTEIGGKIAGIETDKKNLQEKLELFGPLVADRLSWSDTLYEISNLVPPGIWLTGLVSSRPDGNTGNAGALELSALALSTGLVYDFADALNASPYFEKTVIKYASKAEYNERDVFSFELVILLKGRE